MKAIVYTEYGLPDVLKLREIEKPIPGDSDVLVRIRATSVTTADCNVRGFTFVPPGFGPLPRLMFGWRKPKRNILGYELSGEIEAVGNKVKLFNEGDAVFGSAGFGFGAYAEYICLSEKAALALKPANLSHEEAAAIPFGAVTALFFLRDKGNITSGQKVLINGASGGVGVYAVQLAKHFGAEVTGVCSKANLQLVQSLGADKMIDYTREDFRTRGETYDIILDTVAGQASFARCRDALSEKGLYLAVAGGLKEMMQMLWTPLSGGRKVIAGTPPERKEDLIFLKELIEAGKLRAVIDRHYPLEETAEAHRYVDQGHKRGSVVITVSGSNSSQNKAT